MELGEDWQAVQVWARLGKDVLTLAEDGAYTMIDAVSLTVEAVHAETKGRRIFTVSDYPAFIHHGTRRRGVFQLLHYLYQ